jgi:hypothetical protein
VIVGAEVAAGSVAGMFLAISFNTIVVTTFWAAFEFVADFPL